MRYLKGVLCIMLILVVSACEEDLETLYKGKKFIQVAGRVTEFNDHTVSSRALKSEEESEIKTMSMFLFDNAGVCVDFQYVTSSSPLFVIDRTILNDPANDKNVSAATIYIMANVPMLHSSYEDEFSYCLGRTMDELMDRNLTVEGIDIPTNGFPMIGSASANLELNGDAKDLLEIPLKHLYAKMVFNIKIKTKQSLTEFIPTFQMSGWEVHNVPNLVSFDDNVPTDQTTYREEAIQRRNYTGNNPVSGSNTLSFSFYLPEHLLQSDQELTYPEGIKDNEKQRFKPLRISQATKAPFVKIKGTFSDHQGHSHNLTYDIYLGKDNWENFEVVRNFQYNNNVTITGITNSTDGTEGTVTLDHRVNVERGNFTVSVEREAMLDSHIEVRPLRVDIIEKEGINQQVKLFLANPTLPTIPISPTNTIFDWARMEVASSALNGTDYCDNGQRKYFTTTLLDELNNSSGNGIIATLNTDNCVWIYFDENLNVSKTGTRKIMLVAEYYEDNVMVSSESYYFQQHDLFPVIYKDEEAGMEYRYDIEYYEEYLYHYDSKDGYNATTEGMIWGPKETISSQISAVDDASNLGNYSWIKDAVKSAGGFYDFYDLYTGRAYTAKLVTKMNQSVMSMDVLARSAAEHCYNKNKRDSNGVIETGNFHWYLPAIGELQRIMTAAYVDFLMFQDNYYWSSQTTYGNATYFYQQVYPWKEVRGNFYYEDTEYARATKTTYKNGVYSYEGSEVTGVGREWEGWLLNRDGNTTYTPEKVSREPGNLPRDGKHRVRAVRNKYQRAVGAMTWTEIIE